jgi:hypothetical protein
MAWIRRGLVPSATAVLALFVAHCQDDSGGPLRTVTQAHDSRLFLGRLAMKLPAESARAVVGCTVRVRPGTFTRQRAQEACGVVVNADGWVVTSAAVVQRALVVAGFYTQAAERALEIARAAHALRQRPADAVLREQLLRAVDSYRARSRGVLQLQWVDGFTLDAEVLSVDPSLGLAVLRPVGTPVFRTWDVLASLLGLERSALRFVAPRETGSRDGVFQWVYDQFIGAFQDLEELSSPWRDPKSGKFAHVSLARDGAEMPQFVVEGGIGPMSQHAESGSVLFESVPFVGHCSTLGVARAGKVNAVPPRQRQDLSVAQVLTVAGTAQGETSKSGSLPGEDTGPSRTVRGRPWLGRFFGTGLPNITEEAPGNDLLSALALDGEQFAKVSFLLGREARPGDLVTEEVRENDSPERKWKLLSLQEASKLEWTTAPGPRISVGGHPVALAGLFASDQTQFADQLVQHHLYGHPLHRATVCPDSRDVRWILGLEPPPPSSRADAVLSELEEASVEQRVTPSQAAWAANADSLHPNVPLVRVEASTLPCRPGTPLLERDTLVGVVLRGAPGVRDAVHASVVRTALEQARNPLEQQASPAAASGIESMVVSDVLDPAKWGKGLLLERTQPARAVKLVVGNVAADSPAFRAGIRPGGCITAVQGAPVASAQQFREAEFAAWQAQTPLTVSIDQPCKIDDVEIHSSSSVDESGERSIEWTRQE